MTINRLQCRHHLQDRYPSTHDMISGLHQIMSHHVHVCSLNTSAVAIYVAIISRFDALLLTYATAELPCCHRFDLLYYIINNTRSCYCCVRKYPYNSQVLGIVYYKTFSRCYSRRMQRELCNPHLAGAGCIPIDNTQITVHNIILYFVQWDTQYNVLGLFSGYKLSYFLHKHQLNKHFFSNTILLVKIIPTYAQFVSK